MIHFHDTGVLLTPVQAWREYDGRIQCFCAHHGRVQLIGFGLFGKSLRRSTVLHPFYELSLHWTQKSEHTQGVLSDVECIHAYAMKTPFQLACASYINELVQYSVNGLESADYPQTFQLVKWVYGAIVELNDPSAVERTLRLFEAQLFKLQGYHVYQASVAENLEAGQRYRYCIEQSWTQDAQGLNGAQIKALCQNNDWMTMEWDKALRTQLKWMHRGMIQALTGQHSFKSKAFFTTGTALK